MGRRVRKQVFRYIWNAQTESCEPEPELIEDQRFVYDGWNVVMVGNSSGTPQQKYTWGLDLSGLGGLRGDSSAGIHDAGGIGGLLAEEELNDSYWYFYDGNGNVVQLIGASMVELAAAYEYDPYGNLIHLDDWNQSGIAYANPFRFSTKWLDAETGLAYYGYRYYSPRLGRWLSRDPIEEQGGLNLLAFCFNSPPNAVDPTGRGILDYLECVGGCIGDINDDLWNAVAALAAVGSCAASCPLGKGAVYPGQLKDSSAMTKLNEVLARIGVNTGKWGARICRAVGRYGAAAAGIVVGWMEAAIEVHCGCECWDRL